MTTAEQIHQKRFISTDNTVTDTDTGLTWSHTLLDGKRVTFAEAEQAIAALGEGWRMPTVKELFGLVDHGRELPAIDVDAFPDTKSNAYWSDTPLVGVSSAVWVVGFGYGVVDGYYRSYGACVRAVRSSQ